MSEKAKTTVKIEDVAGRFGFRCRWEFTPEGASFVIWNIVGRQPDGLRLALFLKEGSEDMDMTPDILVAAPYLSGAVRADGRVWFHGDSVFRGALMMKRHLGLLKHVWERAHQLMGKEPEIAWKDAK